MTKISYDEWLKSYPYIVTKLEMEFPDLNQAAIARLCDFFMLEVCNECWEGRKPCWCYDDE